MKYRIQYFTPNIGWRTAEGFYDTKRDAEKAMGLYFYQCAARKRVIQYLY